MTEIKTWTTVVGPGGATTASRTLAMPGPDWDPLGLGLAPPKPHDEERRFDAPILSAAVKPNRRPERVPADPRMRGWRVYNRKTAIAPDRYRDVDTHANGDELVWEHPVTGELRRCEAVYLDVWDDPWREDTERILAEIKSRICTCDRVIDGDSWDLGPCTCGRDQGWSYSEEYWTETIKPVNTPKRQRKLPAQYPMHTRWGRFRDRWWRLTHRRPEPAPAPIPDFDDEEWS
ncbi:MULTISPECIES: hypothetical protein [Mycobacteriaceae]|uniref:hypothetical protein n=1 Tax=Mycobacteriaceae TaxID=1762 RepID=UPI0007F014CF|nr:MULTISPECIES: hypothetical protein [Mycobacteriaceae]MDO2981370.1 hypothetical protein [Mycobacteroides abscessus subsp. abscessus]OBK56747.1 hypothetical protein A5654_04610 [Mycolicibacterium fortuitum]